MRGKQKRADFKTTSLRIPDDLYSKIKERAKQEGFEYSLNAYVVKVLWKILSA